MNRNRYSTYEIAEKLDVSESTVRRWVREGRFPRQIAPDMFDVAHVDAFLEQSREWEFHRLGLA